MPESGLPHWDMTPVFPSLESAEFAQAFDTAVADIASLGELFDARGVRRRESPAVDAEFAAAYDEVTVRLNDLMQQVRTLGSYIGCFVTTDAENQTALARDSQLDTATVPLDQLQTRYIAWTGTTDVDGLVALSPVARDHQFPLRRAQDLAEHQMEEGEESLAAELRSSGLAGWARLHGNMSALLTCTVPIDGAEQQLPMSAVRALGMHPDRAVRRAAFEAELAAWKTVEVPLAAALNGIKGFQQVVRRRRGYADDVEPTLRYNSIDRETLEAMQQACVESFPDFRRYLAAKARVLGLDRLAWYDVAAPVGAASREWPWDDARQFLLSHFSGYSPRLRDFVARALDERWVDAEPHVGKEGGAYCTSLRPGESRIMMNYDCRFGGVSTLAHELGHAYHNLNLAARTPLQRITPSTLAETASIFCETLAFEAALAAAGEAERITLLDQTLEGSLQVVVDIHSRFLFEKGVFERRASRDATVDELKDLMTQAQRATYGPDIESLHPYMWAVKGHYYGPTFYNYPYTFGLLFGLGLFALYRKSTEGFTERYDDLLSRTGLADAATLGAEFGIDTRSPAFWRSSLDVIRRQIDEFERLAG